MIFGFFYISSRAKVHQLIKSAIILLPDNFISEHYSLSSKIVIMFVAYCRVVTAQDDEVSFNTTK